MVWGKASVLAVECWISLIQMGLVSWLFIHIKRVLLGVVDGYPCSLWDC